MKTIQLKSSFLPVLVLLPCLGGTPSQADPVSDAITSVNTEYHKDHALGVEQDFVNLEKTVGSGTFQFGAKLFVRGGIDGKVNASNISATRFSATPKAGFNLTFFGSTVPVVEARYDVGNFKAPRLTDPIPAGAQIHQFKGQFKLYLFNALSYVQDHYSNTVQKNLGHNTRTLWSRYLQIAGPLGVGISAGTSFDKSLVLSVEGSSSAVNFSSGVNLLKSAGMNEFTSTVSSNVTGQLQNYYSNALTASVQDRSISAIGRSLSTPIGSQFRIGASIGPQAAVGIWASAFASVNVVFAGVDVGVRGTLNAISASLKAMLSASNVSQYLDLVIQGTVNFLSGYLEVFGRLWGGIRGCAFWCCVDWTFTIAEGSFRIADFPGIQYRKDVLIARLDLKGPALHWCLTGSDQVCTVDYVVDPQPVLDEYYFACPTSFMNHGIATKVYNSQSGNLSCNYLDSVTNAECAANPQASQVNVTVPWAFSFFNLPSLQFKYCQQPVQAVVPKTLSISREETCPATFAGKPLQSHTYIPILGSTACTYQAPVTPLECVSGGGTVSAGSPMYCVANPSPEIRMSVVVSSATCPSSFMGRSLLTSVFNQIAMRTVCSYSGSVSEAYCSNHGGFEVQVGTNSYKCQNTPYLPGPGLPQSVPAIIQRVNENATFVNPHYGYAP